MDMIGFGNKLHLYCC